MVIASLEKPKYATDNAPVIDHALVSDPLSALIAKSRRNRLIAHWLVNENSKLYCQWAIEDSTHIPK